VNDYLSYPKRRKGLDHDLFAHRSLASAPPVAWPGGARLAVCVSVPVEFFPMDMPRAPLQPPGGMERPGTSFWDFTLRDYGNRVGIYRIIRALDRVGGRATAAMNAEVATRYPFLLERLLERNWEIAASGTDMGHLHHGGIPAPEEEACVAAAFAILRRASGQPVTGWFSPAASESSHTPLFVARQGAHYVSDFSNDDAPYWMTPPGHRLVSLPLALELSDRRFLFIQNQPLEQWELQIREAVDVLLDEAGRLGGRMFSLSVTPWIIGHPYRIAALERVLDDIASRSGVWMATGAEIASAWASQDPHP
jgi:allantoinase